MFCVCILYFFFGALFSTFYLYRIEYVFETIAAPILRLYGGGMRSVRIMPDEENKRTGGTSSKISSTSKRHVCVFVFIR